MSNQERTNVARAKTYAIWPDSKNGLPQQEPTVKIVFHGLLCFFFDGKRMCFVGVHNTTAHAGHPHPHRYEVNVWEKPGGVCPFKPKYPHLIGDPKTVSPLDISVTDPDLLDGVYVFTKDTFEQGDSHGQNDPYDWRWVISFDELRPSDVDIDFDTLRPGVTINNGLFHTLRKTCAKFKLHFPDQSEVQIAYVNHYVAANIYLKPTGKVILSGGPFSTPCELKAGLNMTYQVDIFNDCHDGNKKCDFLPASCDPKQRNDFHLYYDTLRPNNKSQVELIRTSACPEVVDVSEELRAKDICETDHSRSSDDSPCGATGYDETPPP